MCKTSPKLTFIAIMVTISACDNNNGRMRETEQGFKDSVAESLIDSANFAIAGECDTLMKYKVPVLVKAVTSKDSLTVKIFSDSLCAYKNPIVRVEKIIGQLKADCNANLLKETYRRVQQLQKSEQSKQRIKKV
jgi:hypothetical protein